VERVSCSRAASDVAATTASRWILAATGFRWILAATTSSRSYRTEFQYSYPTFRPWILATTTVGTSSWRASHIMGNTSVVDTDAIAAATFFFPTDGKLIVPILSIVPFIIQAKMSNISLTCPFVFKCPSSSAGREFVNEVLNMKGSGEGEGGGTGNDAMS
jgi:hypothetical protein